MQSISLFNTQSYHISTNSQSELVLNKLTKRINNIIIHKNQTTIYDFLKLVKQKKIDLSKLLEARHKLHTKRMFYIDKIDTQRVKKLNTKLDELHQIIISEIDKL